MEALLNQDSVPPAMYHILVVDDDPGVRDLCVRALRLFGYQVTGAENGRVALTRLTENAFDLVLTDLQMPEMGGISLLQQLRQLYSDTDVIVFTAYGTFETAREALRLGAADYLTKPVGLDDLERTVRRALEWRRVRQEKQRLSEIVALFELSKTFTSTLDIGTAVQEIMQLLWRRFSPASLSLSLLHPEDKELEILIQRGTRRNPPAGKRIRISQYTEETIERAHAELVGAELMLNQGYQASIVLRTHDRPVGMLQLSRSPGQPSFGADDRTMLAVCASQIAASLENIRLYQQQKEQNLQTIAALAAAIEARDPYTRGHSEQVMRYAVRLAEVVGLPPEHIEHVRYGALLHDIGKIGIRDDVLLKPGPLTDEEREVMAHHPMIGADILRHIKSLRDVIPMIECHHERMDGKGYPFGKKGLDITPEARILAIADSYDAMTSNRAYRAAMSMEQAFHILSNGRGTQWDSDFVDVFISLITQESNELLLPHPRSSQLAVNSLLAQQVHSLAALTK
ncbi:MAG TPA: HD domain-containing phosphohydrolase [Roseiflexaceae bacterium]|jgi:putative nucleotidyltransferase with HDIG domain|nr:HD domain-containing phosphohydrolase [Roseiflexaceae bacterium]